MADQRLVMEVMCEDPAPQIEWKDCQEGKLEEKPWHEEHGKWADMSEDEQMYREVICDDPSV